MRKPKQIKPKPGSGAFYAIRPGNSSGSNNGSDEATK